MDHGPSKLHGDLVLISGARNAPSVHTQNVADRQMRHAVLRMRRLAAERAFLLCFLHTRKAKWKIRNSVILVIPTGGGRNSPFGTFSPVQVRRPCFYHCLKVSLIFSFSTFCRKDDRIPADLTKSRAVK